jgi:hypothetical protein
MIYKLYVNIAGWSKLDFDHDKKVILDTMAYDNKKHKHTYYMIVKEDKNVGPEVDILRSQEEIDHYINAYNERKKLDDMSCIELKRQILDMQEKSKVKTKGTRKI